MFALLATSAAYGDSSASVSACIEAPQPGDVAWASARTFRIETNSGVGTSVSVSPDGFLMTAAHVVAGATEIAAVFPGDEKLPVTVVRTSEASDLALLRVERKGIPCMPMHAVPIAVGADVYVIGSPLGAELTNSVSKGIVSGYREMDGHTLVQTDATINHGNSGGPMVGPDGDLVGIVSFKATGDSVEGLGFAVAATNIPAELDIRWGVVTDASLLQLVAMAPPEDSGPEISLVAPKVALAPGVTLNDGWYTAHRSYAATTTAIALTVVGGGMALAGATMTDPRANFGLGGQTDTGFALSLTGGLIGGISLLCIPTLVIIDGSKVKLRKVRRNA